MEEGNKIRMRSNMNVTKGERLLTALAKSEKCELTPEGVNYVRQRFDPYHDTPIKPVGYPDSYNGHTISRCIKKTIDITATTAGGSAPTGPWNCHIFHTPLLTTPQFKACNESNSSSFTFVDSTDLTAQWGGLMAIRSDSSSFTNGPHPIDDGLILGQVVLTEEDLSNMMRVTAVGFEFIDTTAELYRQGLLTAYRMNEPQRESNYMEGFATGNDNPKAMVHGKYFPMRLPPVTTSDAMVLPDTKQWKTSEGAYVVLDFNDSEIPMKNPTYDQVALIDYTQDFDVAQNAPLHYVSMQKTDANTVTVNTSPNLKYYQQYAQRFMPTNLSGIMLTGLNPLFSGTVNVIYYVECAPCGEDVELLTLASQSPALDPLALQIVSKLRRDSPIAVKLRENYMGEWFFNGIRDIVKKVVPWMQNATVVGNQVARWIDTASTNDGYINPQSLVRGDVATKIASEKKGKGKAVPKAPGPAPQKRAFKPVPIRTKQYGSNLKQNAFNTTQSVVRRRRLPNGEYAVMSDAEASNYKKRIKRKQARLAAMERGKRNPVKASLQRRR